MLYWDKEDTKEGAKIVSVLELSGNYGLIEGYSSEDVSWKADLGNTI